MKPIYRKSLIGLLLAATPILASATIITTDSPLYLSNQIQHSAMLILDNNRSMDSELLFPTTTTGNLWLDYTGISDSSNLQYEGLASSGAIHNSPAQARFTSFHYLFPIGITPSRTTNQFNGYAVPPISTLGFTRSSEYNKIYYNPATIYVPWPGYPDIDPTSAPNIPNSPTLMTTDLTKSVSLALTASSQTIFKQFTGWDRLTIPEGHEHCFEGYDDSDAKCQDEDNWKTTSSSIFEASNAISFRYLQAHYYVSTSSSSASYTIGTDNTSSATTLTGSCSNPTPSHYDYSFAFPNKFQSTGDTTIHSLAPDGRCLVKHVIDVNEGSNGEYGFQLLNFANWYSYYRKRSLTMVSAILRSLQLTPGMRVGQIDSSKFQDATIYDTSKPNRLRDLMSAVINAYTGHLGATSNTRALDNAGVEFNKSGTGALITDYCQKNFALLFTTGHTIQQGTRTQTAGHADRGEGQPYADNHSNTLADLAMYYYKQNFRSDLPKLGVKVPARCSKRKSLRKKLDCRKNLHLNTYVATLGARGDFFGNTHFTIADAYSDPPGWPDVAVRRDRVLQEAVNVDDLYHAAVNSKGGIFNSDTPEDLAEALTDAMRNLARYTGSSSKVTFNSARQSTNSMIYLASFSSSLWTGTLSAHRLNSATGDILSDWVWSADEILDQRDLTATPRTIISYRKDTGKGIPFSWSELSSAQKDDLKTGVDGSSESVQMGRRRLDYLSGDREFEGTLFRDRVSLLGDIVHSNPVYVGLPEANWPDTEPFPSSSGNRYSEFVLNHSDRTETLWVGANDGALHAFDSSQDQAGGEELLAYIPNALFSAETNRGLHYLTNPDYVHRFYVDGTPTVTDAFTSGPDGNRSWRTVVVGNLRSGGSSLFAIDATDPSNYGDSSNAEHTVLWEFSSSDDSDLGVIPGQSTVTMSNAVDDSEQRWIVVSSGGYNGNSDKPHLFINFLDPDLSDGTWTSGGSDYVKIRLSEDLSVAASPPAVVDLDNNGTADRIYVGDSSGKLWVIDISSSSPSDWDATTSKRLLFTSTGNPITTEPLVVNHPTLSVPFVVFGTGKFLELSDVSDTSQQAIYAIADKSADSHDLTPETLLEQSITEISHGRNFYRVLTSHSLGSDHDGWKIALSTGSGERVVTRASIRGQNIYLNTLIPASDACDGEGEGWLMAINLENGGEPLSPAFDSDGNGIVNNDDKVTRPDEGESGPGGESTANPSGVKSNRGIPIESALLGEKQYTPGTSTSSANEVEVRQLERIGSARTGRLSWQEKTH